MLSTLSTSNARKESLSVTVNVEDPVLRIASIAAHAPIPYLAIVKELGLANARIAVRPSSCSDVES